LNYLGSLVLRAAVVTPTVLTTNEMVLRGSLLPRWPIHLLTISYTLNIAGLSFRSLFLCEDNPLAFLLKKGVSENGDVLGVKVTRVADWASKRPLSECNPICLNNRGLVVRVVHLNVFVIGIPASEDIVLSCGLAFDLRNMTKNVLRPALRISRHSARAVVYIVFAEPIPTYQV
jgi:hypothetical protein